MTTKKVRARGRPRNFDLESSLATAQKLFHAKGYDEVSVNELTRTLGINPPSFYAAFGSKLDLYTQTLTLWNETGAIPLQDILQDGRPTADCLMDVLKEAAHRYARDPAATGCFVLEGAHCSDAKARAAACSLRRTAEQAIREYVAKRHPEDAESVTSYVTALMTGLSAQARNGQSLDELLRTVAVAAPSLHAALVDRARDPSRN